MPWTNCFETTIANADDVATIRCLEPLFESVVRSLMALSGVALFIMLVIGGYNFLFAGGDQKKLEKARGTITSAIIGLVIITLAYLILLAIQVFTGVDVTNFRITIF